MHLTKLAALSLLLSAGPVTIPLERAIANDATMEPPVAQAAPPPSGLGAPPPEPPAASPPPPATMAPAAPSSAVTHSSVNLRNGPGTNYAIITLIPAGSAVDVSECKDGWCQVAFQSQNGYIIQSSIAPNASGTAARARPRPAPGYYAGPPPAYDVPPPGYYPPPPPAYGYYPYRPYYGGYWGWRRGYWRRW